MRSNAGGDGGEDHLKKLADELSKTLKEGERILGPTRRPDGTIRKPRRIRAGYTPQDEVPIYIPRGSLRSQEMQSSPEVPPGYDPVADSKPKTKAAKRNERKKEKRQQQQATLEKDKDSEDMQEHEQPIASQLNELSLSAGSTNTSSSNSTADSTPADKAQDIEDSAPADKAQDIEDSAPADKALDIDKKIRAVKKKIRLAEAQLQKTAEQGLKPDSEKLAKIEGWREELQLLEDKKKAEMAS